MTIDNRNAIRSSTVVATTIDVGLLLLPFLLVWSAYSDFSGWPHEDDQFYARPVQWAVEDGRYELARLKGLLSASTVSHVVAGIGTCTFLGFSYRNLFLTCILQQWMGSAAIYGLGRMLLPGRAWALLLALTFALNPWYFGHAFTFMTDGPSAAWGAIVSFACVRAFVTQRLRWLVVCSAAVSWGFWMRQTNLVLIGSPMTALTFLSVSRRSPFEYVRGVACLLPLPIAAILLLESGLLVDSDAQRYEYFAWKVTGAARLRQMAISGYRVCLIVGMFGLPFLPVLWSAMREQAARCLPAERRWCHLGSLLTVALVAAPFVATMGRACITQSTGTTIQNAHWGPILLSDQDEPGRWGDLGGVVWPIFVWQALTMCSLCTIGLLAWWITWLLFRCGIGFYDSGPLLALAIGFLAVGTVAAAFYVCMITYTYDRYWLVLLAPLIVWLGIVARVAEWRPPRTALWTTGLILGVFFVWNVIFVHDHLAWNNLRWRQVHAWLADGVPAQDIDGGLEVNAWFRLAEDPYSRDREGDPTVWWSGFATRAIAAGPRTGWVEINRLSWRSWATGRQHELVILRKADGHSTRDAK